MMKGVSLFKTFGSGVPTGARVALSEMIAELQKLQPTWKDIRVLCVRILLFPMRFHQVCVPPRMSTHEYVTRGTINVLSEYCQLLEGTCVDEPAEIVRLPVIHVTQTDKIVKLCVSDSATQHEWIGAYLVVCCGRLGLMSCSRKDGSVLKICLGHSAAGVDQAIRVGDMVCLSVYMWVGSFVADLHSMIELSLMPPSTTLEALANLTTQVPVDYPLRPHRTRVPCTSQQRAIVSNLEFAVECVQGPPGTGKTVFLYHVANLRRPFGSVVLMTAVQNRAVEAIVARFAEHSDRDMMFLVWGRQDRMGQLSAKYTLDGRLRESRVMLAWHKGITFWESEFETWRALECDRWLRLAGMLISIKTRNRFVRRFDEVYVYEKKNVLNECSVIICTLDSISSLMHDREYSAVTSRVKMVCVDEAGTVPDFKVAMLAKLPVEGIVLVGDHMQLPPFSHGESVIPSVLQRYVLSKMDMHMLRMQFRMHPELASLVSDCFYGGRLLTDPLVAEDRKRVAGRAGVLWADMVNSAECTETGGESLCNEGEARFIADALRDVDCAALSRVVVITFYQAQVAVLRGCLGDLPVLVCTVDSAQGMEADIVVLSCVRKNDKMHLGFVGDERRVNVAISRARLRLIVVGHAHTFSKHRAWGAVRARARVVGKLGAAELCF
jgi:hypothetical protein